jgi:hypothetical protein
MIIYLGCRLPGTSSDLPEGRTRRAASSLLFGLAPGGVCHALSVTRSPVSSYLAISPFPRVPVHVFRYEIPNRNTGLCIFCGTFPASRRVRITDHPALWSSDFPHPVQNGTRSSDLRWLTFSGFIRTNFGNGRIPN